MTELRHALSLLLMWTATSSTIGETKDYCQSEYFNATCPPDSVILMTSASYGRMDTGNCISGTYGKIGCYENVLDYMDKKCSGRRHCEVYIADSVLHSQNKCPRDLAVYLEAEFSCLKGTMATEGQCSRQGQIKVTQPEGFLTSEIARQKGIGTRFCPWIIKAKPGQRISLTYYNFAAGTASSAQMPCYEIGTVTEPGKRGNKRLTTCGADRSGREGQVYLSTGSDVTIELQSREVLSKITTPFVIKYQTTGCATDQVAPPGSWIHYDKDVAIIKCNHSEQTWYLSCSNNAWAGERPNCTSKTDNSWTFRQTLTDGGEGFPYGILIVVAIGVALGVFIGGLVLSLVYFYMKRKRNPYQEPPHVGQQELEFGLGTTTLKKPPQSPGGVLVTRDTCPPMTFEEHEHVCGNVAHAHDGYYSAKSRNFGVQRVYDACASSAQRSGHVYESPQVS